MVKGQKSSASSGTRKKHARKAAQSNGEPLPLPKQQKQPKDKTKGKGKSKEPRIKQYIPPTKPIAVNPDPIDALGLAKKLQPDLLVVLRRLGKKDSVTKRKALEDWFSGWVNPVVSGKDEGSFQLLSIETALQVWLHHLPTLFLHTSRHIRQLSTSIHASLLRIPSVQTQITFFLREVGSTSQVESILGSWCMAMHDPDRQVAMYARRSWSTIVPTMAKVGASDVDETSKLDGAYLTPLLNFVQRSLLDPQRVYLDLNPVQHASQPSTPGTHTPTRNIQKGGGKRMTSSPLPQSLSKTLDDDEGRSPSRSRVDEEEESETDRRARLRIGGLGTLKWAIEQCSGQNIPSILSTLLVTPLLWTSLYHGADAPFCRTGSDSQDDVLSSGPLGDGQPLVRKSAWGLLSTLVKSHREQINSSLQILSSAVLRSAWVEPDGQVRSVMWEPLLLFLLHFPESWKIDAEVSLAVQNTSNDENEQNASDSDPEDEDGEDESDDGGNHEVEDDVDPDDKHTNKTGHSSAYQEFLQFLQLGYYGSPTQGYPAIILVLSSIPSTIIGSSLLSVTDFLTSFWSALDGRALTGLDRAASSAAFLSSLLECLILLVKRVEDASIEDKSQLLKTQVEGVVKELVGQRLKVDASSAGRIWGKFLISCSSKLSQKEFDAIWSQFVYSISTTYMNPELQSSTQEYIATFLSATDAETKRGSKTKKLMGGLISDLTRDAIAKCECWLVSDIDTAEGSTKNTAFTGLYSLLQHCGDTVFEDATLAQRLDTLTAQSTKPILTHAIPLFIAYISHRGKVGPTGVAWNNVLSTVAGDEATALRCLPKLLDAVKRGSLPSKMQLDDESVLDTMAGRFLSRSLSGGVGSEEALEMARGLMSTPYAFLSRRSFLGLLHTIVFAFSENARTLLRRQQADVPVTRLRTPLDLISSTIKSHPELCFSEEIRSFLPDFFTFGYLYPKASTELTSDVERTTSLAKEIWETSTARIGADAPEFELDVRKMTFGVLKDLIGDVDCSVSPATILQAIHDGNLEQSKDVIFGLFPSREVLDEMLEELPSNPIDPTLSVVEPLVPPYSLWREEEDSPSSFDTSGLCEYARTVDALLTMVTHERHLAKENNWLLRHCMCLSLYATDALLVPNIENPVFSKDVSPDLLESITSRTKILTAMLLTEAEGDRWHEHLTKALGGNGSPDRDDVTEHVSGAFLNATSKESIRDARILYATIQRILNGATAGDAEHWMLLARKFETKARLASEAIILAVSESGLEPPRLDRLRNELAAESLGVKPHQINTDGLRLLHHLALTVPDPDSDVVFLPQNRAVNFMKACQSWITSDEDIEEDVESEMLPVFLHLLPILQSIPGAHWDLVFDVIENNLENSSFDENSSLVTLTRTLQLLTAVQELTRTNKALRATWQEREVTVLKLVRDIVQSAAVVSLPSTPRSMCWEMAFSIVQNLPEKLFDENTLHKMVHLLLDRSASVQKMAYSLLQKAANKRTEYLVIEAGIDTSSEAKYELPEELLQIVTTALEVGNDVQRNVFGFLLGWMIIFDSFNNSSLRVKMGYGNQLRDLGLIENNLLPTVLDMLDLYAGGSKPFPLDPWAVSEFYIDYYDPTTTLSPKLLSAHLFYRALLSVPSLVSTWWSALKDKQLQGTVSTFTTRHFSPVLISAELAHVRDPDVLAELSGDTENWKVKVANSVNEVMASYTVDEYEMEIAIRLPVDYPLHGIEVRDVKRLGAEENRWRGWLLAVQQVITSQNGRIVDGLSMFKKNVTHHFENQTECAICYSIISVTELSLPKKRCKTCKNRFHASCLYKWFNTSHTSSCPLCRSDFI